MGPVLLAVAAATLLLVGLFALASELAEHVARVTGN